MDLIGIDSEVVVRDMVGLAMNKPCIPKRSLLLATRMETKNLPSLLTKKMKTLHDGPCHVCLMCRKGELSTEGASMRNCENMFDIIRGDLSRTEMVSDDAEGRLIMVSRSRSNTIMYVKMSGQTIYPLEIIGMSEEPIELHIQASGL